MVGLYKTNFARIQQQDNFFIYIQSGFVGSPKLYKGIIAIKTSAMYLFSLEYET
jgi:hypothetical protein